MSAATLGSGHRLHDLVAQLYPICRSITGDGVRATLHRIQREIPLVVHEVPSGTRVLDWTVPKEWNVRDAYVLNSAGERVIDFRRSTLHVVSYSVPVRRRMSLAELRPHLHALPEHPDWIPYRTAYYEEDWGFCLTQLQLDALPEGEYEVCVDTTLADGSLTYGECLLAGTTTDEVLVSCHVCHPSLCNDNLSGIAVAVALAQDLSVRPRRHTFRFLFIPGTIGSITWLALNESAVPRIKHGLVLTCLGDSGHLTYKRSRRGDAPVDRAARHVLTRAGGEAETRDFTPYGYDERQYCSPGYDLPVGCLMRTPYGEFPEYHTSADNLDFIRPESLADSVEQCRCIIEILEGDGRFLNLNPKGEPQLGRRGLYRATGGGALPGYELALLWVLSYSDGHHSLLDIADRAGMPFAVIRRAADALVSHDLLREI